ncbi:hypothetical protein ACFPL7_05120 [Dongia soli]|uniref:Uncharacterized protein n=1 Tax=Dongia soli TaxID=600628 RepID=A0ABU5EH09_9PROT|nr:hypothetical protein [Dongia soli]MDY0884780.1 hypothetical protein [Dongia soli]
MVSQLDVIPHLRGAPRYSPKRNRFVFGLTNHELFVAVAVDPRICNGWCQAGSISYGECSSMLSQRRDRIEAGIQCLLRQRTGREMNENADSEEKPTDDLTAEDIDSSHLEFWNPAELEDAF